MTPASAANPSVSPSATANAPALPAGSVARLVWTTVGAIVCGAALTGGIMAQVTFAAGAPALLTAVLAGAACVLVAAGAGLVLFAFAALALLAGSTLRMLASVSMALVVYFLGRMDFPTGTVFWVVFLVCGLAAIVVEAAWGARNLNRLSSSSPATSAAALPSQESSTPSQLASAHGTH